MNNLITKISTIFFYKNCKITTWNPLKPNFWHKIDFFCMKQTSKTCITLLISMISNEQPYKQNFDNFFNIETAKLRPETPSNQNFLQKIDFFC